MISKEKTIKRMNQFHITYQRKFIIPPKIPRECIEKKIRFEAIKKREPKTKSNEKGGKNKRCNKEITKNSNPT